MRLANSSSLRAAVVGKAVVADLHDRLLVRGGQEIFDFGPHAFVRRRPALVVAREGIRPLDLSALDAATDAAWLQNPKAVASLRAGKAKAALTSKVRVSVSLFISLSPYLELAWSFPIWCK